MATLAEIEAAIAKAEKAGRADLAAELRAYAQEMQPAAVDEAQIRAAAEKFRKAGNEAAALEVLSYLPDQQPAMPAAEAPVTTPQAPAMDGPAVPPRAEDPQQIKQRGIDEFALFEMANPILKGRYTPETMPKVGDVVPGQGGGGKSGAAMYTVQPWGGPQDTFGETAQDMMAGPIGAMQAFNGGLTGGPSPSRDYLANDPLTRNLPGPALTALGGLGDAGGAGLSAVGAGLSGLIGLGVEAVPGQNSAQEGKLGNDLLGMSMFAVPELAGVSSVASRAASGAVRVAPKAAEAPSALAGDVAAAERRLHSLAKWCRRPGKASRLLARGRLVRRRTKPASPQRRTSPVNMAQMQRHRPLMT
jgi:hypothetical protein